MDAYRRGVAAILKKIRANAIMCCGHKEYALPVGRKDDPTFDMDDFRSRVSAIMAGIAPAHSIIPATDSANRPTLRRGDSNEGRCASEWDFRCCYGGSGQAISA
jgi:hypothetical protein